jgi:hypothetical protein
MIQKHLVSCKIKEFFIQTWKKYDPRASKFMPVDDLENIVMDLVVAEID